MQRALTTVRTRLRQLPFYSGRPLLSGLPEGAEVGAVPLRGGISKFLGLGEHWCGDWQGEVSLPRLLASHITPPLPGGAVAPLKPSVSPDRQRMRCGLLGSWNRLPPRPSPGSPLPTIPLLCSRAACSFLPLLQPRALTPASLCLSFPGGLPGPAQVITESSGRSSGR